MANLLRKPNRHECAQFGSQRSCLQVNLHSNPSKYMRTTLTNACALLPAHTIVASNTLFPRYLTTYDEKRVPNPDVATQIEIVDQVLKGSYGHAKPFDVNRAIAAIYIGTNDLTFLVGKYQSPLSPDILPFPGESLNDEAGCVASRVVQLYDLGVRNFVVLNNIPLQSTALFSYDTVPAYGGKSRSPTLSAQTMAVSGGSCAVRRSVHPFITDASFHQFDRQQVIPSTSPAESFRPGWSSSFSPITVFKLSSLLTWKGTSRAQRSRQAHTMHPHLSSWLNLYRGLQVFDTFNLYNNILINPSANGFGPDADVKGYCQTCDDGTPRKCKSCADPDHYVFFDQVRKRVRHQDKVTGRNMHLLTWGTCYAPRPQLHPGERAGQILATALQQFIAEW